MPTEEEFNILEGGKGLLGLGRLDFDENRITIEFEDERKAALFSLMMDSQYPLDDQNIVSSNELRGCFSALPNYFLYSLKDKRGILEGRRLVYLVDTRPKVVEPFDWRSRAVNPGWFERRREIEDSIRKAFMRNLLEDAKGRGYSPKEVVMCRTPFGEDFYGAVGAFLLRSDGYIVFPEATLTNLLYMWGTPDMVAVKLGSFQEELVRSSVIERGALLDEIELYGQDGSEGTSPRSFEEEAVAVEVESSSLTASKGHGQLDSYVSTGYFDYGLLICPDRVEDEKYYREYGYISWHKNGRSKLYRPRAYKGGARVGELLEKAKALVAYVLIKHLPLDRLAELFGGASIIESLRLSSAAKALSLMRKREK